MQPDWHGRQMEDGTTQWGGFPAHTFSTVRKFRNADRVSFLCPMCFAANGGPKGTHRIAIDFEGRGTPDEACMHNSDGQPVRWNASGTSLADLTLAPSIQIIGGCNWHGYIRQGRSVDA